MLRSMTGFGAGDAETESYRFHIEVKAVNQRYLDIDVRMPYVLNRFDDVIKKKIKEFASRGKLSVSVSYSDKRLKEKAISVDTKLALAYKKGLDELAAAAGLAPIKNVMDLAKYPDVMIVDEAADELEGCEEVLVAALTQAMAMFVEMREKEGANIAADFSQRLDFLASVVDRLESLAPRMVEHYRQRLTKVLEEIGVKPSDDQQSEQRIVQEVALYADRVDYTEEFVRLRSHIKQFRNIMGENEPVGRKLDFLIQEMNREINTTTSKSPDIEVSELAVKVKSEIEKLREQIQNIE